MVDIAAVGEILIDFTPSGTNDQGIALFGCNPGGAPANVLAALSKLGRSTAFIGKVGRDAFGDFLRGTLEKAGVGTGGLAVSDTVNTTLAFVQLDERGDRSFSFYRDPGADLMLEQADIDEALVTDCGILHFGSVSLSGEPARGATLYAARTAKAAGRIISYDPNYRSLLWKDPGEARQVMLEALKLADIVKVSEEEMELLTGETDLPAGAEKLAAHGAALVLVSLGAGGAFYRLGGLSGTLPTYDVKTVDTTGAGDAFVGAVLHRLCGRTREQIAATGREEMEDILSFANACGSLTTTRRGAIPALPTLEQIEACRRGTPLLTTR